MGRNAKDITDWGIENEERNIRQLNPTKDQAYIEDVVAGNPNDRRGSFAGNRTGSLRGAPSVTYVTLDNTKKRKLLRADTLEPFDIYIEGYNMYNMTNLYLSGSTTEMFGTSAQEYSYFNDKYDNRLSTENPPFSGIQIDSWVVLNNNNIYFTAPAISASGSLDIILQGPAGWYLASEFAYGDTDSLITITTATTGTETSELCGTETSELCGTETSELCGTET